MQFITNGPDIPNSLLEAHEEGRVVFFCGAGISYPAGLPGFKGLVENIYERIGDRVSQMEQMEQQAFEQGYYDLTLDLLERRLPGQRLAMREALAQTLKPQKETTDTHAALLQLARNRENILRLVTTNFDRIFHDTAKLTNQSLKEYAAPQLPIPKKSRWDGLVYLHGLLQESPSELDLNNLVVTSGDFGLAYLTERWASRFVSELFRNYIVCFVGYSINDPVMRYMMDALAADRMLGESTPQAWVFDGCTKEQKHQKTIEWEIKGVKPILYHIEANENDHSNLHKTLHAWSETYRDGITGKERIAAEYALTNPSKSTRQDDFVGRMLWALSDPSGKPAKYFAESNPVPSLDWLYIFSEDRYGPSDLTRFGISPHDKIDQNLESSLIKRPCPYSLAPEMQLVAASFSPSRWDKIMPQLAHWLTRHLNDPRLILWITSQGDQLHELFVSQVEFQLDRLAQLERDGRLSDLDDIRKHAPNAIPGPFMRTLWQLLLSGKVKSFDRYINFDQWQKSLLSYGLTMSVRSEFRKLLSPKIQLDKPYSWNLKLKSTEAPSKMQQLVEWKIVFNTDISQKILHDLTNKWESTIFSTLLDDLQLLLRDALDLQREMSGANDLYDESHLYLPSIIPHYQNRGCCDWVSLIELLRDSWLERLKIDPAHAARIAAGWFELPYPTFKRLALFAATQEQKFLSSTKWVKWLLVDEAWWLWSIYTKREVLRLLATRGRNLTPYAQKRLEKAILLGPSRDVVRPFKRSDDNKDYSIWLRLAKLKFSGLSLGGESAKRLEELSRLHPDWQLASNESDEFSCWTSINGDPDFKTKCDIDSAPRTRSELVKWLRKPISEQNSSYKDAWRNVCQTRFFHCIFALCDLAHEEIWPMSRWQEALQVWSDDTFAARSWRFAAPLIEKMPDKGFQEIVDDIGWWIMAASKSANQHEEIMLKLCERIIDSPLSEDSIKITKTTGESIQQPVTEAFEHPIGQATEAILNIWLKPDLNDGDSLPENIRNLFTKLCDPPHPRFRHGRVILSSQLITLFRTDRLWTERYMLPLFDWNTNSLEAQAAWKGFLKSPRLYQPLLMAFKKDFLDSAQHYSELTEHRVQFVRFLTYAALNKVEGYTVNDFRSAMGALPQEGLEYAAEAFAQAINRAGKQISNYWEDRAYPFWQNIWPKHRNRINPKISASLAKAMIFAKSEFPVAFKIMKDWLQPVDYPNSIVHLLHESTLCKQFPCESLKFLHLIIDNQQSISPKLDECLKEIVQVKPDLEHNDIYMMLRKYI